MKKLGKIIFILITLTFVLSSCGKTSENNIVYDNFYVSVLNVGKADTMILRTKEHTAVIDCGEKGDGKEILEYLSEQGIDYVDYLFITHFDKDHVGGAAKVINNINIGEIITPDYAGSNDEYESYIEACEKKGITPTALTEDMSFTLDDVSFNVYAPQKTQYKESDNDYSLVISVTHGENKFLFAGDAEKARLKELSSQFELKHTFLKVPHHGRENSESEKFIKSVSPDYAVITCSEKEMPDDSVTEALAAVGSKVYLTKDGQVDAVSDGKKIDIIQ